jgi:N-acyl-D-aspartate/D-glutamate deacylase
MTVWRSPVAAWRNRTFADIWASYRKWRSGTVPDDEGTRAAFDAIGMGIRDEGEFFLALLAQFDRDLYWTYVAANRDPAVIRELLLHPLLLPGFNDSGAHVTNMAFYDGNLRALRIGLDESEQCFSHMVGRLTREPADFFGIDAGRIDIGSSADITLIDPQALAHYDGEAGVRMIRRDLFGCEQLVNRSDGVVDAVFLGGRLVWDGTGYTDRLLHPRAGRALRAR